MWPFSCFTGHLLVSVTDYSAELVELNSNLTRNYLCQAHSLYMQNNWNALNMLNINNTNPNYKLLPTPSFSKSALSFSFSFSSSLLTNNKSLLNGYSVDLLGAGFSLAYRQIFPVTFFPSVSTTGVNIGKLSTSTE